MPVWGPLVASLRPYRVLVSAALIIAAVAGDAYAVSAPVVDDAFTGASVVSATNGTMNQAALFDGSVEDPDHVTFFPTGVIGTESEEVFRTTNPVGLDGIRLLASNDGSSLGYRRAMNRFQFFADTDGDGTAADSERVVDQTIDPNYDAGQTGDLDAAPNGIEFVFRFANPTTSRTWRVVVTQGALNGVFSGVRVSEIDAIATPPATVVTADPPVQGLFTLRARLTLATGGAPVAGQVLVMSTTAGEACRATTGADGFATCSGSSAAAAIAVDGGYTATFAGSPQFRGSFAKAMLLTQGQSPTTTTTMPSTTTTSPGTTTTAAPTPTTTTTLSPQRQGILPVTGGPGWTAIFALGLAGLGAGASIIVRRSR